MTTCKGFNGQECPLREKCKRFPYKQGDIHLAYAPFEGSSCQFFYDKRRDLLPKSEGHIRFDNKFEYIYKDKQFQKIPIDYSKIEPGINGESITIKLKRNEI